MMHERRELIVWSGLLLLFLSFHLAQADQPASARSIADQAKAKSTAPSKIAVRPLLTKYCTGCHGAVKPKAGVNLTSLLDDSQVAGNHKLWSKVKENIEGELMPPEGRPQPARAEVEAVTKWIELELAKADCGRTIDPGRVTIRRLNRNEYNNTIRDLVGLDFHPADDFPSDDVGYGFDNIGDVLTIPPILMEKYIASAESIAEQAIMAGGSNRALIKTYDAVALDDAAGGDPSDEVRVLASSGEIRVVHAFPRDGFYTLRVRACGQQAGPEPVRMAVLLDGKSLKTFDVKAVEGSPQSYEIRQRVSGGKRAFAVAFLNDYYNPQAADPKQRDRNLLVDSFEIEGPIFTPGEPLPESHRRIVFQTPKRPEDYQDCATAVMQKFASRAYRRPVTGGELAKLLRFVDLARENGDSFERGIQLAVQATLVSPQFLFRVELSRGKRRSGSNKASSEAPGVPLNDFEVASRLSYFFWSTMPDDELSKLALAGTLHKEENLTRQVRRMLRDPKAQALVDNFAGQWLQLRNLAVVNPDREQYPAFDEPLRAAMQTESQLFFASVMKEDRSILDFLDCDYTYLNERLARHYGVSGVAGKCLPARQAW